MRSNQAFHAPPSRYALGLGRSLPLLGPRERRRWVTAMGRHLFIALLLAPCLISCDDVGVSTSSETRLMYVDHSYERSEEQQRFKEALRQAGVPFETHMGEDGREHVRVAAEYNGAVDAVVAEFRGPILPSGRYLGFFDQATSSDFKTFLNENQIHYETVEKNGHEYVIWSERDTARVKRWQYFPRDYDRLHQPLPNKSFERPPDGPVTPLAEQPARQPLGAAQLNR